MTQLMQAPFRAVDVTTAQTTFNDVINEPGIREPNRRFEVQDERRPHSRKETNGDNAKSAISQQVALGTGACAQRLCFPGRKSIPISDRATSQGGRCR